MCHVILTILYLAYVQGHHHRPVNNPYSALIMDNDPPPIFHRISPGQAAVQNSYNARIKQFLDYPAILPPPFNYPPTKPTQFQDDPYNPPYNRFGGQGPNIFYYLSANNLREPQYASKTFPVQGDFYPFDLDYVNSDVSYPDTDTNSKNSMEGQSHYDDLELVENFGTYLKKRTQLGIATTMLNDAGHQYNGMLSVLITLATAIRNSCADFDEVYDQIYKSTVENAYRYGLHNPDKVLLMIEDYIRKGNAHIPKLRKLKQELCEIEPDCAGSLDNKIKSSALLYVKELETVESIANLARSFYPYIEEFNQAAQRGTMLHYLQNGKDRLREYVMHIVNSIEHLSDKPAKCS